MSDKSQNTGYWIGRVLIIFFFLLIASSSESASSSRAIGEIASIEQSVDFENTALVPKSVDYPEFNNTYESQKLLENRLRTNSSDKIALNHLILNRLKTERAIFIEIKPRLLKKNLALFSSDSYTDYPLVS